MEEYEKYILVAGLRAVSHYADRNEYLSFSLPELQSEIKRTYSVEIGVGELGRIFEKAAKLANTAQYIEHIKSPFASDRFHLNVEFTKEIASVSGGGEVWESVDKAGADWLAEALTNISERLNLGENPAPVVLPLEVKSIPASDRYVSILDNQEAVAEIASDLESIRREVEGSNSIDDESRLIALSEIALFEAAICQPRLAQDIIERFLGFCASKLANLIGGALVGYIIDKLKILLELFLSSVSTAA
ncbi:hypothetical protein [Hyphomonas sp. CACIAM 19H1]|uniref:hypothetical protein n=1 Tax=Hyphomonas sp. CACIAM 19H1 TaxID=1873716 RepID=UPI0013B069D4|nr:hypothetical protein [Hyphomonas sp. CACIAM 19H1]